MNNPNPQPALATKLLVGLALAKFALHLVLAGRYGFHRDELYYLAGGLRPAFGYVDHPPLTPLVAGATNALFGSSLVALRGWSAAIGALIMLVTGLIAREFGGRGFAQGLAALAVGVAPIYLVSGLLFQTVPFDQLAWVCSVYLLLRLVNGAQPRIWLVLGVVLGVGLQFKHTMLFLGFGLAVALLLTRKRAWLQTPWPYAAALIALVLFLPNVLWQIAMGFPTLEFIANSNAEVREEEGRIGFLLMQLVLIGPLTLPIWSLGIVFLFRAAQGRYRLFGWIVAVVMTTLTVLGGKPYYAAPLYPLLLAAGAVAWEQRIATRSWRVMRPALIALVTLGAVPPVPALLPVLPPTLYARSGLIAVNKELGETVGWPELVAQVAQVYNSLPPQERAQAAILTANYGQAGAIELFGSVYGLPQPISGHNSYYHWGPGGATGEVVVAVGLQPSFLRTLFAEVTPVATIRNPYDLPNDEQGRIIAICRRPVAPLPALWPRIKHFG